MLKTREMSLKKSPKKREFTQKRTQKVILLKKDTKKNEIRKKKKKATRWNIYYGRTLADEALYYSTIYPNSHDLGTAE